MRRPFETRGWALLAALALLLWPAAAWASNFAGLWIMVYGIFIGIPYGIALLVLGIVGLVFVVKKQHRPVYGRFLLIGSSIATTLYVVFPLLVINRSGRYIGGHLIFSSPIIALTLPVVIFGLLLLRKRG